MRWAIHLLACLLCQWNSLSALATEKISLSVLPFATQRDEQQVWLGKGIADMLMRNLSEVSDLTILERHNLQTFLNEMELGQTAFFKQDQAIHVGRIAKLNQVIYGNYTLNNNEIKINLLLVDLHTQKVILNGQISGDIKEIHNLVNQLSLDFIKQRKLPINERALANIKFTPTDSIPATEHYYRAMDSYDHGDYSTAFSHFYAASKQDPTYWESLLWMGRMLEFLEMDELAISAYLSLNKKAPQKTEGNDALLFAAMLMENIKPADAIAAYKTLSELKPALPHSIEAAFHLGKLYEQQRNYLDAYQSYSQIDSYYNKEKTPTRLEKNRQSRFFRWFDVLALSRDSIIHMISLYPKMTHISADRLPQSPRGMITISKDNPGYKEIRFGETKSIFSETTPHLNWREKFYAIAVPDGYVATGIDLQIKGHLTVGTNNHDYTMRISPFPLPRNYHNTWLGVIYGQTRKPTTLKKHIPFYGKHQKLITLQFIENFSKINSWQFILHLQPEAKVLVKNRVVDNSIPDKSFYEAQLLGQLTLDEKSFSGITQPLAKYWYAPRQTLALVNNFQDGLSLIFVKGELGGEQTDLMMAHSQNGKSWSKPESVGINSLSEDFAPKLIRAEDGSLQLFWISNRRGLGWEIWTSRFEPKTKIWQSPNRLPLESFAPATSGNINYQANNLLHYAVTQDIRGRWVLAYRSYKKHEVLFLTSEDAKDWELIGKQRSMMKFYNPTILQDKSGVFRLAAVGSDQQLHLWSSTNLKQWRKQKHQLNSRTAESYAMHPMHLFSEQTDRLLLLLSDADYGLRYTRFNPDISTPSLDLVKDINLDAYTITGIDDQRYLIAQRKNDQIEFRLYRQLQSQAPDKNSTQSILYSEFNNDTQGNDWRRIYARMRVIQPDVTTVAVEPDGRVWWGIETGVMALKDDDFFSADVTDDFFHHHVTDIVPCDNKVFFASKDLDKMLFSSATKTKRAYKLDNIQISNETNAITAIHCGHNDTLFLGSRNGKLFSYRDGKIQQIVTINNETITAIIDSKNSGDIWLGTMQGNIYRTGEKLKPIPLPKDVNDKILALATDSDGIVWASVDGHGIYRYVNNNWRRYSDTTSLYDSISIIRADPKQGVWMMPDAKELSSGVIYSDGINSTLFNSPDKRITAPTGLAIDTEGHAWIGTAFDGLFEMKRARQ